MYQQIMTICSPDKRARGCLAELGVVLSRPYLQKKCLDEVSFSSREGLSLFVFEVMDRLGYSFEMVKYRQQMYREIDSNSNKRGHRGITRITTGGKSEGTALYYESDIDYMNVIEDILCSENPKCVDGKDRCTLFRTERKDVPPGYTRLKLVQLHKGTVKFASIRDSIFKTGHGEYYLSSEFFAGMTRTGLLTAYGDDELKTLEQSGPSIPQSDGIRNQDVVCCFKCKCPEILENWIRRPRYNGWPSQESIDEISSLDGHVVPVGMKGSETMYQEWRICFSLAELHLMRNLNETQVKLYIILKKLCKSVLNPVCKEITSYIMKNVVLWICERNGLWNFKPGLLIDRLFDVMNFLKKCIHDKNLPSYMIPERNLLAGRIDHRTGQQLSKLISDLLDERGRMLLRYSKLREAMIVLYRAPGMLREFSEKRDKVENLILIIEAIRSKTFSNGMAVTDLDRRMAKNEQCSDIEKQIAKLIQFDMQALKMKGRSDKTISDMLLNRISEFLA